MQSMMLAVLPQLSFLSCQCRGRKGSNGNEWVSRIKSTRPRLPTIRYSISTPRTCHSPKLLAVGVIKCEAGRTASDSGLQRAVCSLVRLDDTPRRELDRR